MFMIPSKSKKAALTELPMIPPTDPKLSNLLEKLAAVAATAMEVTTTILDSVKHRSPHARI